MRVGFVITAFDQKREVKFTVDMLRNKWKRTSASPISIVISGDPERNIKFPADPLTRVTTLDDMVGNKFNQLVSTSIMKQISHGIIELMDLERLIGTCVDVVVHMHGDVLLLNENGFFEELEKFYFSGKNIAADTVGAQVTDYIYFEGYELMPQLFAVRRDFIGWTNFMKDMYTVGDLEKKSTEWALRGNLIRNIQKVAPGTQAIADADIIKQNVYVVKEARSQWDLHKHWGGWCHWGNSLHFSKEIREQRNEICLRAYGLDLSTW